MPSRQRPRTPIAKMRSRAVLVIFAALAILGLLGGVTEVAQVCTKSMTAGGVVQVCRPFVMTDPPMVFGTLVAVLLLGPDARLLQHALPALRAPAGTVMRRGACGRVRRRR